MAITRYNKRRVVDNSNADYLASDILKNRGITKTIPQFTTPVLQLPEGLELSEINILSEVWGTGINYFKLAKKHYGSEEYWWIIAWFNMAPMETDFKPGDDVLIPLPLEKILAAYGVI
jgi:hypothetical protein